MASQSGFQQMSLMARNGMVVRFWRGPDLALWKISQNLWLSWKPGRIRDRVEGWGFFADELAGAWRVTATFGCGGEKMSQNSSTCGTWALKERGYEVLWG